MDTPPTSPLALDRNPLLAVNQVQTVRVDEIDAPTVLARPRRNHVRDLKEFRRREKAKDALAALDQTRELYGFTKGQFSLLDLLRAALAITGPARLSLSTWTAARHEIQALDQLVRSGTLLSMRWLVDFTFARRDPEAAHQIRLTFGLDAIRVAQNHAKFAILENDAWRLCVRTSMNLNMNPRFEDFTIAHDPELADFLSAILNDIWSRQKRSLADGPAKDARQFFTHDL